MAQPKRTRNDENLVFNILDTSAPPLKRTRRVLAKLSAQELQVEQARLVAERKQNEAQRTEELQSEANAKASELSEGHLQAALLSTTDQQHSARVSRMLGAHGGEILALMHQRRPDVMRVWAVNSVSDMVAREGKVSAEFLRPSHGEDVSEILGRWSLDRIQKRAQDIAPTLCKLLEQGGFNESLTSTRRNHGLVMLCTTSKFLKIEVMGLVALDSRSSTSYDPPSPAATLEPQGEQSANSKTRGHSKVV
ncbi:hypothetical protein EV702DRAFT_1271238 [Suillus placidus]|uniref:Uncharacterized protein n=1 Tax=Suillus placidus TaxID=48579 RepID=A0A9P7CX02_9AGAM|nr:hypothetical protein EV702DRAFT_1271238 [Suillus placidus]